MNIQGFVNELLVRGYSDRIDAYGVVSVITDINGPTPPDAVCEISLDVIRQVVEQGLMEISDPMEQGECYRKGEMCEQKAFEKVETEWCALDRWPKPSEICFLQITNRGREITEELLKNIQDCMNAVLIYGLDRGGIGAYELSIIATEVRWPASPEEIRWLSVHAILQLLRKVYMEIGYVLNFNTGRAPDVTPWRFLPWNLPHNEAKERVESMWRSLGRNPRLGEICYLQITPMGRKKGEELLLTRSDIRMNSSGRHPMVKIPNRQIAVFQELLQKYNPKLLPRFSSSGYFDIEKEEVDSIQHFVCNEMVVFGKNEDEFNQYGHDMEELIDALGRPFM